MAKLRSAAPARAGRCSKSHTTSRRGAITVFMAVLLVVLIAALAFAVDCGMICLARTELQRTADASALAATSELLYRLSQNPTDPAHVVKTKGVAVRLVADDAAKDNKVFQKSPNLQLNSHN